VAASYYGLMVMKCPLLLTSELASLCYPAINPERLKGYVMLCSFSSVLAAYMHPKDTISDPGIATFRFLCCASVSKKTCDHAVLCSPLHCCDHALDGCFLGDLSFSL
jgi:hypothetical protein